MLHVGLKQCVLYLKKTVAEMGPIVSACSVLWDVGLFCIVSVDGARWPMKHSAAGMHTINAAKYVMEQNKC